MSLFRRRSAADQPEADEQVEVAGEQVEATAPGAELRVDGPWDISEVENPAEGGRADLGGMWLPGVPGLEVRIDGDKATGHVNTVTLVLGDGALQVQPFAAPRTEAIWHEVRGEIKAGITSQGGTVDEVDGPFGTELQARLPFTDDKGVSSLQPARFFGVDGPRWFLRGVFSGRPAVDPAAGEKLLDLFREIVVVRGTTPMAPREPLPLRLPTAPSASDETREPDAATDAEDLQPFERGPEITEIR